MRLLGKLLFFNKQFMTNYVTTIGNTIYFPEADHFKNPNIVSLITAHELVHVEQGSKLTLPLFWFLYLFPQCLALLALLAIPLFFINFTYGIIALCMLLFLAPIPAYWRAKFELEGYTMSLVARALQMNERQLGLDVDELVVDIEFYDKQFVGAGYYFMWPFGMKEKLLQVLNRIEIGDISENERWLFATASNLAQSFIKNI